MFVKDSDDSTLLVSSRDGQTLEIGYGSFSEVASKKYSQNALQNWFYIISTSNIQNPPSKSILRVWVVLK